MPYLDKDAILQPLSMENITDIVMELGADRPKKLKDGVLQFQTICHGGDSHKLYYYHKPNGKYAGKIFHCYTGCGDSFGLYDLIMRVKEIQGVPVNFYQAVQYAAKFISGDCSVPAGTYKRYRKEQIKEKGEAENIWNAPTSLPLIKETCLDMFRSIPYEGWLQEYITEEAMSKFEIGFWGKTNQVTIPHRDSSGNLVGIRGRYLNKRDIERIGKYAPLYIEGNFLSHSLGNNLYGIFQNQRRIKKCRKALLVEGEKSVLQCHSYFGNDDFSLAVCGNNLTQTQIYLLLKVLEMEEVILGFDKEYESTDSFQAKAYWNKLIKKLASVLPYCEASILWDESNLLDYKDSPTDKGADIFLELLEHRKTITMNDLIKIEKE